MFKVLREYWTIKKSGLFDPVYYLLNYPDVRRADIDPLLHFIQYGWKEGRNPSLNFNTNFYLINNPYFLDNSKNPLINYINNRHKSKNNNLSANNTITSDDIPLHSSLVTKYKKDKSILVLLKRIRDIFFPYSSKRRQLYEKIRKLIIESHINVIKDTNITSLINNEISSILFTEEIISSIQFIPTTNVVDIIICVGPNPENFQACITSIRKYSKKGTYNVNIVINKADYENNKDLFTSDLHIYSHEMTLFNYARANNLVLKNCKNDVILLNDDTEVTEGWIEKLKKDSRGIALTGAHTNKLCSGNPQMWGEGPARFTEYPINMFCAYIPKRVREVVGLLDEEYSYYGGEDTDYSCRVLQNGFPLIISSAFVIHKDNQSFKETKDSLIKETFKLLYEKYNITPPFDLSHIKPKVSIIMATHNRARLLKSAIDSLENINYDNFELIIIDDGSDDNSNKIIVDLQRKYKNIKFIRLAENKGSTIARQVGIHISSGQFICFCDDDDIVLENRISSPLNYFIKHPDLDVVYCNYNTINDKNTIIPTFCKPFDYDKYLDLEFNIGIGILLARKRVIDDVPFLSTYDRAVDYDWVFRLLRKGYKIDLCPEIVMNYNRTGSPNLHLSGNQLSIEQHKLIYERELLLRNLSNKRDE